MDSDTDIGSLPSKVGPFKLDSRSSSKCTASEEDHAAASESVKRPDRQALDKSAPSTPEHAKTDQACTSTSKSQPEFLSRATYQPESGLQSRIIQTSAACNISPESRRFYERSDDATLVSSRRAMNPQEKLRGTTSLGPKFSREQKRATPPSSPRRSKIVHGADLTPTPIRGDFIEVSSPIKIPSPPPQPDEASPHGVTLHLSLTESQMDRLNEVISRPSSPDKGSRRGRDAGTSRETLQRSHIRAYSEDDILTTPKFAWRHRDALDNLLRKNVSPRSRNHFKCNEDQASPGTMQPDTSASLADRAGSSHSGSSTKKFILQAGKDSQAKDGFNQYTASSIAHRRGVPHPSVDTMAAQQRGSPSHRQTPIAISRSHDIPACDRSWQTITHTSRNDSQSHITFQQHPSSSIYSIFDDEEFDECGSMAHLTPLPAHNTAGAMVEADLLRSLAEYETLYTKPSRQSPAQNPGDLKILSTKTGIGQMERQPRIYSPLTPYIECMEDKVPRHKVLIGEHGWLERTGVSADDGQDHAGPAPQPQAQKKGIFESIKKVAKEVVELADMRTSARGAPRPFDKQRPNRLDISLDPREQSLFYCELEFLLTTALDGYLTTQFNAGRVHTDRLSKVAEAWRQKGRPRVVGFRYDVETQLDIVLLHLYDFKFYGVDCTLSAVVTGVLEMVKSDARAMRVRTFCQPDLVMAKQLLDAQKLLNILGCREQLQLQLNEVVCFFKLVLNPEKRCHAQTCKKCSDGCLGSPVRRSSRTTGRSRDQHVCLSDRRWQSQSPTRRR